MLLTYKFMISSNMKTHTCTCKIVINHVHDCLYFLLNSKKVIVFCYITKLFLESSCKHKHRVSLIYVWFLFVTPRNSLISIGNKWIFTVFSDEFTLTVSIWQGFVIRVLRRTRNKPWSLSYINDRIRGFYVF